MAESVMLQAKGLYSFPNILSSVPQGALTEALNVVIDRDNVLEPRRGLRQYSELTNALDRTKQMFSYKGRLISHFYDSIGLLNKLAYDDGSGNFTSFNGSYNSADSTLRMRGLEYNGNFYFTSDKGVKKISAGSASDFTNSAGFIKDAGAAKALELQVITDYTQAGFLQPLNACAYKVVWGYKDANQNLILGTPSFRAVAENVSEADSCVVKISFPIPQEVKDAGEGIYFYQIYRTAIFSQDPVQIDPGNEMNLVYEEFPSSAELTSGLISNIQDTYPEDLRAANTPLYSNPYSGEGSQQVNDKPPFAKDIEIYKDYTFYSDLTYRQQTSIQLLATNDLVSGTSYVRIYSTPTTYNTYTFRGAKEKYTLTFTGVTKAGLSGKYFRLFSARNERKYTFYYDITGTDTAPVLSYTGDILVKLDISALAGGATANEIAIKTREIILNLSSDFNIADPLLTVILDIYCSDNGEVDTITPTNNIGGSFAWAQDNNGIGEDILTGFILLPANAALGEYGPSPSQQVELAARSLTRVINADADEVAYAYYLGTGDNIPGEILLEQRSPVGAAFWIIANNATTGENFNPTLPTSGQDVITTNEEVPNGLAWSKVQQPEAVPPFNLAKIGPKDSRILRIKALRDGLFIFKEEGTYRLTGDVAPFSITLFSNSINLKAPDSTTVLNNQIYCLTSQGVSVINDTGDSIISRSIENKLLEVTRDGYTTFSSAHAVAYETDRAYLLWLPSAMTDAYATQCLRYNIFTNSWTRWDVTANAAIVFTKNNKLYVAEGNDNYILQERKDYERTDYADKQYDTVIPINGVNEDQVRLSNISNIKVGDVLVQSQYLTIEQFNRMLNKLDLDPYVTSEDYYDTLHAVAGDNLRIRLDLFAQKLDGDGLEYTDYESSLTGGNTFQDFQIDFNIIINKLNIDTKVQFSNYSVSSGIIEYEATILSIINTQNTTTVSNVFPFISGPITSYRAIVSKINWAPQTFGDPSTFKQVNQGTVLFDDNNFTTAQVGFGTDLSPSYSTIDFSGSGNGDWGFFSWGEMNWGGLSNARPLRTYIPRDKQRCRYMNVNFKHSSAREKYAILGISLSVRPFSNRAYVK
jgi:hypothetical protein